MTKYSLTWKGSGGLGLESERAVVLLMFALVGLGSASEFPDRECCDSAPPPPPFYHTVTSTSTTSTSPPPSYEDWARRNEDWVQRKAAAAGPPGMKEHETMNCLVAKRLCDENSNCSAILKVIPMLCGPELVACSTVTVSRCQAALRTLALFPWFQPTCLCREPSLDAQCNIFRDLVFDHPCVFVNRKEVDMHPLHYIPTCELAAEICRDNPWCKQRLDMFKTTCKFRDGQCRNPHREECLTAWLQLRETPLLGCICPGDRDKRKCSRLYSLVNENPCVESDYNEPLNQLKHMAGTCHSALKDCMALASCKSYLELVSRHCETYNCHQEACKSSIQDIYKHLMETDRDLALKIALCVCSNSSQKECVEAQRRLHPPCAQMKDSPPINQCHNLGRDCRNDRVCRYQLEHYELSCAADTMTGRCAGQHKECTKAMLGLLGTDLHTNCVCKGTNFYDINQCLAWKRLLWGNPCVVETQLTYHIARLGVKADIYLPVTRKPERERERDRERGRDKDRKRERERDKEREKEGFEQEKKQPSSLYAVNRAKEKYAPVHTNSKGASAGVEESVEVIEMGAGLDGTRLQVRKVGSTPQSDHTVPHPALGAPSILHPTTSSTTPSPPVTTTTPTTTPTTTTTTTTTTTSTTTTLPTTTLPERYCKIKRPWDAKSRIIEEHTSIRLYKDGDKDCSELCFCEVHERTKCKVLDCIENLPCETDFAVYNHNAPAYQAFRGECICYSGDFICMRPRKEEYQLTTGLFLLLGFSRTEEALLKNVTGGSAVDALMYLQMIIRTVSAQMGSECRIKLFQHTSDNLILQVRLFQIASELSNKTYTTYMWQQEREQCEAPARKVAEMIKKRDPKIHDDVHLSLFVLAEVVDNIPNPQKISAAHPSARAVGVGVGVVGIGASTTSWWVWLVGVVLVVVGL